ncbi:hypothetical protein HYH03_012581 [Edaphochlamys debaryana]|uniref:mannose-6-phosphate isomerase n=1 Tax=Edaphochlamys debaryana TaxID=47281 RepID=A0A836BVF9_9CHLO|nr:hypothetical protein HYH03_012581 [Edaphochlamys debaryana]|eukprot:KAG2488964.1 hypothetical protein HYH03_012581 [Edaphochlamys debaryana]
MGAHPTCPSKLQSTGASLASCLERCPQLLGDKVVRRFGAQLPFLFKVLSVNKALSIQSHPDKQLAERLHAEHPKLYADPNHKPEMALALSDFEALCGFASTQELQDRLRGVPELASLVGPQAAGALLALEPGSGAGEEAKQALRTAFTRLMTASPEAVTGAVRSLVERLKREQDSGTALSPHEALALRLNTQFPDDVGVFSAFFLNLVTLPPGHAIYLPANEPHAYLAGELVECMAASDNVIRAGLTPKFKHAEVLCDSLTYRQGPPDVLTGTPAGPPGLTLYRPPFEEFEIHRIQADSSGSGSGSGAGSMTLPASGGPRILLVTAGEAEAGVVGPLPEALELVPEIERSGALRRGSIVLIAPGVEVALRRAEGLEGWVAAVNGAFLALAEALPEAPAGEAVAAEAEVEVAAEVEAAR